MQEHPAAATRRELPVTVALAVLTMTAGAADVIGFLSLGGVFTALQTGNVLFLAFALLGMGSTPAWRPALSLVAFTVGAALGSAVISTSGTKRWFPMVMGAEGVLLGAAGATALRVGVGSPPISPHPAVICLVALAMGLQSMAALRARVPGMSTQLIQVSLVTLVDAVVSPGGDGRRRPRDAGHLTRTRHSITIGGVFVGGLLGALLTRWGSGPALLVLAAAVLISASGYAMVPRYRPPAT
ncbi:DUF1275 domain-containing protein [Actinomycetospora endophytica]|uniref:DUF1275 domain-containing protein n=1 Tax=Actinomycetospora endophytica TaxID=2291215 RepID=A0ABS8P167_9PSEU|nr:YoaK family protein [Actinomycetospora endophytica]MCD2191976.1 DUF1275 domain-containing protein [Actinomycetospora endophytica]